MHLDALSGAAQGDCLDVTFDLIDRQVAPQLGLDEDAPGLLVDVSIWNAV